MLLNAEGGKVVGPVAERKWVGLVPIHSALVTLLLDMTDSRDVKGFPKGLWAENKRHNSYVAVQCCQLLKLRNDNS